MSVDYEAIKQVLSTQVKGPFVRINDKIINCTWEHPVFGELPFSAGIEDTEDYGKLIYEICEEALELEEV